MNIDLHSGIEAFDAKNFAYAYQLLAPLANNGNAEALWRIGMMQSHGLGMVTNQVAGVNNFKQAAKLGHNMAHHMLGVAYMMGEGVDKDIKEAVKWFEGAVDMGLPGAAYSLSMIYTDMENNPKLAKFWLKKAEVMDI